MERGTRPSTSTTELPKDVKALPEHGADPGVSEERFGQAKITVTNSDGYLCHISSEAILKCPPSMVFAILSNPDNSTVFRDVKAQGYRKVLEDTPDGYRKIEVEQKGEVKILFKRHTFSTFLTVTEDSREGEYKTSFALLKSDILSRFQGTWTLNPVPPGAPPTAASTKTRAVLEQDVMPAGVPAFVTRMPVLGSILRGICVRTVKRLVEDLDLAIAKVHKGTPLEEVLRPGKAAKATKRTAAPAGDTKPTAS